MNLFFIPFRSVRVKWMRALLLIAVFMLGVASMTGLRQVSALIGESFERKLVSYGANILVTPKRETLKISYGGYTLGDIALEEDGILFTEMGQTLEKMPLRSKLAVIAPKMLTSVVIAGQAAALVGVDWAQELALKAYWEIDGQLPSYDGPATVLLGAAIAEKLGLRPGQTVQIGASLLPIDGVLMPTGSDDDNVIFAPLAFVGALTGKPGQATFVEFAALCSGCPIDDIVDQLQEALPFTNVLALRQVAESRMYAIDFAQNLAFYVSLVILLTGCAMIVMSMLSAVNERRKEIGIMRAVGFSRASVFAVFVSEAVGVGFLAGIGGYGLGLVLSDYVLGQLHLADTAIVSFEPLYSCVTVIAVSVVSGIAAAFPAWKASLVEPAEALIAL